jgi:tetrahydromethanopterin S-methyltransferase subunit E
MLELLKYGSWNSLGGNTWCCLLANMALIFAIDSTMDSIFGIPTTKESTFASMVAFHTTSSGGFGYILTFLVIGCCPMLCYSLQPTKYPC